MTHYINSKILNSDSIKRPLLIVVLLVLSAVAYSQADDPYTKLVDDFLADASLKNASTSFCVLDAKTRHQVFGFNENLSLVPASNMKIITTVTAAEMFGPDFRFETKLVLAGEIADNILFGDILIIGGGDPTLGSDRFGQSDVLQDWLSAIKAVGIKEMSGRIIAVDTLFSGQSVVGSTPTADIGNYYGAGAHSINWRDNQVEIHFMSEDTDGGETVVSHTVPDVPRLKLYNHVKASDYTRDNAYIHGAPGTYERSIYGTIPKEKKDFVITGSIPDPAHQLAWELHLLLKEDGFNVKNEPTTTSDIRDWSMPSETEEIHRRQSPALKDILIETNLKSVNTYADVLLKHIGLRYYGKGDFFSGVNAIMQFWGSRGVPRTGWYQEDGSGLSRANSISSKQLALVLAKLNPKFREWFKMGFKSLAGDGDIVAKSGYITRVRAYTGFISIHGTEYAFSILCNNFACSAGEMRKKIEALMSSIKGARLH